MRVGFKRLVVVACLMCGGGCGGDGGQGKGDSILHPLQDGSAECQDGCVGVQDELGSAECQDGCVGALDELGSAESGGECLGVQDELGDAECGGECLGVQDGLGSAECGDGVLPDWVSSPVPGRFDVAVASANGDELTIQVSALSGEAFRLRYVHEPANDFSYAVLPAKGEPGALCGDTGGDGGGAGDTGGGGEPSGDGDGGSGDGGETSDGDCGEGGVPALTFGGDGDSFKVCTGPLSLMINKEGGRVALLDGTGTVLFEEPVDGGYTRETVEVEGADVQMVKLTRTAPSGERYFGFGEKTGKLDKRGRVLQLWNSDHPAYAVTQDPLYQSIPFFISFSNGAAFGQLVDNSYRMVLDMAATKPDRYTIAAQGGEMDVYLLAGPAISKVIERYTGLTGRMPLPPRWALGYHQCRWSYFPDSKVKEICDQFRKRQIPADGIWLDIDYMDGYRSWTWSPQHFPDPSGLTAALDAIGFKVTAIIDPALKVDPEWDLYKEGAAGKHFLEAEEGKPFVGVVWPGPAAFPDFTRPETRAWWGGLVHALTDHGVRGVWLDMNEPASFVATDGNTVPGWVPAAGDGVPTTMSEIHNVYALEECRATREGLLAEVPGKRPFLLTRAGFAGIQRYSAVWTGDAASKMESLKDTLPMLLGLGLSGVPFVGSDVGGWSGGATPELFARWIETGAISPFFRAHVQTGAIDQEPWAFGAEVEDISRLTIGFRYRLLPYLYSLFREAELSGAPVLRPLVYEFQDDPGSVDVSYQAMLGPHLMFAPVLDSGVKEMEVYFPPGKWTELHSGALYEGPATKTVSLSLQALPVFLRQGGVVPMSQFLQYSDQAPVDPLYVEAFAGVEEGTFRLHEDDGDSHDYLAGEYSQRTYASVLTATGAKVTAKQTGGSWTPPQRTIVVHLRRVDHAVQAVVLDGTALPEVGEIAEVVAGAWTPSPGEAGDSPAAGGGGDSGAGGGAGDGGTGGAGGEGGVGGGAGDGGTGGDGGEGGVGGVGWWRDANDLSVWVVFPDPGEFDLAITFDPAITEEAPVVVVPVEVTVPGDTPPGSIVHIATSASGWKQQALTAGPGNTWTGEVPVPRGQWFEYKYTRGDWPTVEKWAGCLEADNRYAFGKAHPVKVDEVEAWADTCGGE